MPLVFIFAADRLVGLGDDQPSWLKRTAPAIAIAMVAALALLPLIKGTFLLSVLALGSIGIVIVWRKNRMAAFVALLLFPLFMVAFWCAAGQSVSALPGFFASQQQIVSGYSATMSLRGNPVEIWLFAVAAFVILAAGGWWVAQGWKVSDFLLLLATALSLFLAFKEGFVRHDEHAMAAGAATVFVAAILATRLPFFVGFAVVGVSVVVWLAILSQYQSVSPQLLLTHMRNNVAHAISGAIGQLSGHDYQPAYQQALQKIRSQAGFRPPDGPADIYPYDQAYLIASGAPWDPRPIPQSYSAYTPYLLERNRDHLIGARAPEYILFKVAPIDGRPAALDDALSWPTLLTGYQFSNFDGDFAVLTRQPSSAAPHFQGIGQSLADFDRPIPIPQNSGPIWAEIDLNPSLKGRAQEIFYKLNPVIIQFSFANGKNQEFRYIPNIGVSGFVVSPLIDNTLDFVKLMSSGGRWLLEPQHPISITIRPPQGEHSLWVHPFRVKLSKLEIPNQPKAEATFFNSWEKPVGFTGTGAALEGQCILDSVSAPRNDAQNATLSSPYLRVSGWYVPWQTEGAPDSIVVGFGGGAAPGKFAVASIEKRPDVGSHFGRPDLVDVGFSATLDMSGVTFPSDMRIYAKRGSQIAVCPVHVHLRRGDG